VLLLVFLGLSLLGAFAEDWTTSDGKTYRDVKVVSHDAAYVTILNADGGGRVLLATLNPDLQKRFGYDPVKAAAAIAAVAASDQRDKDAIAEEKARSQAQATQGQSQLNDAVAVAALPPPPTDGNTAAQSSGPVDDSSQPIDPSANETQYGTQTEIDDNYGYSGYGYGGYGGYGYSPYGYGYVSSRGGYRGSGNHNGTNFYRGGSTAGTSTATTRQMSTQPASASARQMSSPSAGHSGAIAPGVTAATGFSGAAQGAGGARR
jgi:hypothetical protein